MVARNIQIQMKIWWLEMTKIQMMVLLLEMAKILMKVWWPEMAKFQMFLRKIWWPKLDKIHPRRLNQILPRTTDNNVAVGERPACWTSPPKFKINIMEFLEKAKSYTHLVTKDGLLTNPKELQKKLCPTLWLPSVRTKFVNPQKTL